MSRSLYIPYAEEETLAIRTQDGNQRGFVRHNKNVCAFCVDQIRVDYRNVDILREFLTEQGTILPRRRTGTCAKHQRQLARAIKRARHLALLPHAPHHTYPY